SNTIRDPSAEMLGWNSSATGVFTPAGRPTAAPLPALITTRSRSVRPAARPSVAAKMSAEAAGAKNTRPRPPRRTARAGAQPPLGPVYFISASRHRRRELPAPAREPAHDRAGGDLQHPSGLGVAEPEDVDGRDDLAELEREPVDVGVDLGGDHVVLGVTVVAE